MFKAMIRWQMLAGALFLLMSAPSISFADVLVISSNGENQALLVDPSNFKLIAALPTGKGPHEIATSPDGRYAYVAISGSQQEAGRTITVLDLKLRAVKATFDLGGYRQPHDLRVSRDGALLWVTCAPSRAVLEVNTQTGKIIRNWKLDKDGAWMLAVTPDERKIYTANLEGKSVSIIDRKTGSVSSIEFDSAQIGMDISPDGRKLWVHHGDRNQISVIDAATDKVVATFASEGRGFGRVKFTPDGKYVLVPQSESKNLVVFEADSRRMVENIRLSASPKVIGVSSDSRRAFITCPSANQTLVVDLVARKETAAFSTGKSPDGISWAASGERYSRSRVAFIIPEEEGYVATPDGTRLFYQKVGSGPQKVIIPGRLFLFDDFKRLAQGRTLVFYDMRGRGRSDQIPEDQKSRKLSIHHDVKDVETIRRHFGFEKFSLIGYSYLGLMSVMYAMEHPARVERIIQMGPVPLKFATMYPRHLTANDESPVPDAEEIAKLRKLQQEGYHNTHPKDYCEQEWLVSRFRLVGNPANVEKLGKSQCDMPNEWPVNLVKHFGHSFASVQRLDIAKEIAKVTAPVLTIHGTKDRNAAYGAGREWAFILPNARLLTIRGAAHAAYVEAPEIIFPAINAFLNGKWPDNVEKVTAIDEAAKTK